MAARISWPSWAIALLLVSLISHVLGQDLSPHFTPQGSICSEWFGKPEEQDCAQVLATVPQGADQNWFLHAGDPNHKDGRQMLPWSGRQGMLSCGNFSWKRAAGLIWRKGTCGIYIGLNLFEEMHTTWDAVFGRTKLVKEQCLNVGNGVVGGWSQFGDIFVVVTQPVAVQAENQVLWTSTAPAAAAATSGASVTPDFLSTDGQSWYRASFWAGKSNSVNASGFPGFDTAQGWTLDNSAYSPLSQNETNACPGVSTCNSYLDCCDNTYCVHRLVDNNLAKVCVPGIPPVKIESQGNTQVVSAGQKRRTKQRRKVIDLTEEEQMAT
ncbi:MAG: hypothetical protein Q9214_006845 [Letrouitia sp. 1 TL-2023]